MLLRAFHKFPILRGVVSYAVIWPSASLVQQTMAGRRWRNTQPPTNSLETPDHSRISLFQMTTTGCDASASDSTEPCSQRPPYTPGLGWPANSGNPRQLKESQYETPSRSLSWNRWPTALLRWRAFSSPWNWWRHIPWTVPSTRCRWSSGPPTQLASASGRFSKPWISPLCPRGTVSWPSVVRAFCGRYSCRTWSKWTRTGWRSKAYWRESTRRLQSAAAEG